MDSENLDKQQILERINHYRTQKKLSAYALAKELGHSKSYIYRIENGDIQLTIENLLEILDTLNVTTSEFFCPTLSERDKALLVVINNLSEDNKKFILDMIRRLK